MAKKRRPSPTEKDKQRIIETIRNLDQFDRVKDYGSFEEAYEDYLEGSELEGNSSFKNEVFDGYIKTYEGVQDTRGQPKKRAQEKQQYTRKEELKVLEHEKIIKPKRELSHPSLVRGKVVYSERVYVVVKGKNQERFRDSRGRFASGKIKK